MPPGPAASPAAPGRQAGCPLRSPPARLRYLRRFDAPRSTGAPGHPAAPGNMIRPDRFAQVGEAVPLEEPAQAAVDLPDDPRPPEDEGGVELQQRRPEADLPVRVLRGGDAAAADDDVTGAVEVGVPGADRLVDELPDGRAAQRSRHARQLRGGGSQSLRRYPRGQVEDDPLYEREAVDRLQHPVAAGRVGAGGQLEEHRGQPGDAGEQAQQLADHRRVVERAAAAAGVRAVEIQREVVGDAGEGLRRLAQLPHHFTRRNRNSGVGLDEVDPEGNLHPAARQPPRHHLGAVVGDAVVDDDGLVRGQAEQPRPVGVSFGGALRNRADLDAAEAEGGQPAHRPAALVEAGGEADRVGEGHPPHLLPQAVVLEAE